VDDEPDTPSATTSELLSDFATGSGIAADGTIALMLQGTILALVVILVVWVLLGEFRALGAERSDPTSFGAIVVRSAVLLGVTGILVSFALG